MAKEECSNCKFVLIDSCIDPSGYKGGCRRYPKIITKNLNSWCGEYTRKKSSFTIRYED